MMRRKIVAVVVGAVVLVATATLICRFALAGPRVEVGRPCADADRPSLAEVDHSSYDALLRKYVDGHGMVAYGQWKGSASDMQALDEYLARIGCVDLRKATPKNAQLAYWINAYNALTIRGILREYPTSSIRNHTAKVAGYNIWKDLLLWVDGKHYSLDEIEHVILRKMGEPRIHFALVCASKGCPPLANQAYTAVNLENELAANARRFFAQSANFYADARSNAVHVSQLLKWYGTDFAEAPVQQIRLLRPYLPSPESLGWIEKTNFTVKYLDYDWSLNDQHPRSR